MRTLASTFAILIILLAIPSCQKLRNLTTFHLNYETQFVIPSSVGINLPLSLFTPDITTNTQETFENENTHADLLKEVELTRLQLTITTPAGQSFNFLRSAQLYLRSPGNNEVLVASIDDIPQNGATSISMEPTGANLAAHFKGDEMSMRVVTVTRQAITQNVTVKVESRFRVKATLRK